MIAAAEPLVSNKLSDKSVKCSEQLCFALCFVKEFIPRGRNVVDQHPGPLVKKHDNIPNEFLLLDRMQNVNLSKEQHFNESWMIREIYQQSFTNVPEELAYLTPAIENSEEELYFRGNTAVWSSGLYSSAKEKTSSEICYTSESPIQFAFFCTKNFLNADYKIENKPMKGSDDENQGVGFFDAYSLKVYSTNGENLATSVESPISKIWITKYCIIIEKEASSASLEGHSLPMPRIFSLMHPLDDMFPVLMKNNLLISYITEADYKVSKGLAAKVPNCIKVCVVFR